MRNPNIGSRTGYNRKQYETLLYPTGYPCALRSLSQFLI